MRPAHEIPTALSPAETTALQHFARGMRMIECGALLGYSTLVMAAVAARVVSVDRHEGYGPSTLRSYMSNIEGAAGRVVPIIADARLALPVLRGDRYFLDLDGTFDTTKAALDAIPHGRLVAIHDFDRNNCSGVKRAILAAHCEIDRVVDTLAFVRR